MPAQPPLAVHRFSARSSNLSATDDRSVMRSTNNESLHALCREETTRFSQRKLLMRLEGRDDQAWGELYADLHRAAQRALTA